MTNTLDMQKSGKFSLNNKMIGIGVAVYSVIEAILAFFFFFKPLYIEPVYLKCEEYNADGITCLVKLFGKTLASPEEVENNQVILSLWDTISSIIIIYLIITVVGLILAFCMYKGMSFAKTYFVAFFGAKHIIGLIAMIIPMANMRRSTMFFGVADAIVSAALCLFFVTLTNEEYADDMLFTDEQIAAMNKRMKLGFILYGGFALFALIERYAMVAIGKNYSLLLDWREKSTALTQGIVLAAVLSFALIAAIVYIKDVDWAMFFFAAFGTVAAVSNLVAIISRVLWIFNEYQPLKALYESGDSSHPSWDAANTLMTTMSGMSGTWLVSLISLIVAFVAVAGVAFISVKKILHKIKFKFTPEDKKPATAVLISVGSILLNFIFTVGALILFVGKRNEGISLGAMDYMYFIVYGGIALFLAISMLGGYGFTKFGALAMFLVAAACNFSSIFAVLEHRTQYITTMAAYGIADSGIIHIVAVILFALSIISCFGIIAAFAVKGVSDYMYEKRFN